MALPPFFEDLPIEEKLDLHRAHYSGREIGVWSEFNQKWLPRNPDHHFGSRARYRIIARPLIIPWYYMAERFKIAQRRAHLIWFYESREALENNSPNCKGVDPNDFIGFSLGDTNYEIQERPE